MQLPQIRLESNLAKIGITTEKPVQEIEQPKADLSIQQPPAELSIKRTPGRLTIDQTKAWEDMGLMHVFRSIEEFAEQGYKDWLEGMARTAQQGDELMRIENGGNPLAEQARVNSENPIYEFNIGWIPSPFSVKTSYEPGTLDISWQRRQPIIEARVNKPEHRYTPGKVNVYVRERNRLEIDFAHLYFKGIHYEQRI